MQATERIQGLPPWQESPVWLGLLRRVDARRKTGAHAWLQDWPGLLSDECIRGRSWPLLGPARLQPLRWRRPPSVWSRPGTPRMAITCTPAVYTAPDPATSGTTYHHVMPSRPHSTQSILAVLHFSSFRAGFQVLIPTKHLPPAPPPPHCDTSVI